MTSSRLRNLRLEWQIALALLLVTVGLYWPVRHYDYVNHDDPVYVYENAHVLSGLSWDGILWAFGRLTGEHTYWHPVTWLSLMLDSQLFGPGAGPRHLVNVLLHAVNAALLFLLLRGMTGACWRSAVVAALFAWHPLQVDSVAWIAERKNVLSTLFWLLTLWAYVRYAEGGKNNEEGRRQKPASLSAQPISRFTFHVSPDYALSVLFFALGLMSKPMLVTVPVILLLLDVWPLRRLSFAPSRHYAIAPVLRLLLEKLPFFLLSAASAVITVVAHRQLGSLVAEGILPFPARLSNALISYARYLEKTVWPVGLAVHYPHPGTWRLGLVAGATAMLVVLSVWAVRSWRRQPYLLIGWLWFLVTLLPTIGIIQASSQAMADRFAYVPLIGIFLMLVWLGAEVMAGWRHRVIVETVLASAALAACLVATRLQLRYWRDGETLFRRAVSVTQGNFLAEYNLGCALAQKNKLDEAFLHFAAALKIKPDYAEAVDNMGVVLQLQGKPAEAEAHFLKALQLKPDMLRTHNNLGLALQARGKTAEAIAQFRQVLSRQPEDAEAHNNLGKTLAEQGKVTEAMAEFNEAIRLKPDYASAHYNLGNAFILKGRPADAIAPYLAALKAQPDSPQACQALGLAFAATGKTNDALRCYAEALRLKPGDAEAHYRLGDLLLKQGRANEAAGHFRAALQSQTNYAEAHYQLGVVLGAQRQPAEAVAHFRQAVRFKPDWLEALNNLAWLLATQPDAKLRNGSEAVDLAERAVQLTRTNNPGALDTLAAAYAEAGRFSEAISTARLAEELALSAKQPELAGQIHTRLDLYRSRQPARE